MTIPTQTEMFKIVFDYINAGYEYTRAQLQTIICQNLAFTPEEQEQRTSSGSPVYQSRVSWAVSYLNEAGYLERVRRSVYCLTEKGSRIQKKQLNTADFVRQLKSDRAARTAENQEPTDTFDSQAEPDLNPEEMITHGESGLKEQLASELLAMIMDIPGREGDTFFERLVTDLLVKMGYGEGQVTPASRDGGIDGIITTDPLGFDPVHIQAKRYSVENKVGSPEIQRFNGALKAVKRGAFFTTSTFTQDAQDEARNFPHADIALIDGKRLAKLMIEYDLGVTTQRVIKIKTIDRDYFMQDDS